MRTITALLIVLAASAAWAVTPDSLASQAAIVATEQSVLDSMTSQGYADALQGTVAADSVLAANGVRVLVYAPASGVRDAEYVCVDVPRSTWGDIAKIRWDIEVGTYPVSATNIGGRYLCHRTKTSAVLESISLFLSKTNLEE